MFDIIHLFIGNMLSHKLGRVFPTRYLNTVVLYGVIQFVFDISYLVLPDIRICLLCTCVLSYMCFVVNLILRDKFVIP